MRTLFRRYDEQVRQDALRLSEKGFLNTYKHFGKSQEELSKIYKDIQNEPKPELREEIVEHTDEATDFPDLPPHNKERVDKDIATIIKMTDEAQPDEVREQIFEAIEKIVLDGKRVIPTRSSRMKELIAQGIEKAEVKRIMESEGFEFQNSIFHSEYRRLTK